MRPRYIITDTGERIGDTLVYSVLHSGNVWRAAPVEVWVYPDTGTCRCTQCSGLHSAMLSTCAHAQAVRRYLKLTGPSIGAVQSPE